jgi:hypothetical protein
MMGLTLEVGRLIPRSASAGKEKEKMRQRVSTRVS